MALCCVGVDLVVVFVLGYHHSSKASMIYYVLIFIFSCLATIVSIIHVVTDFGELYTMTNPWVCRYTETIQMKEDYTIHWIWYYSVIFAISLVSTCCSLATVIKLFGIYNGQRHASKRPPGDLGAPRFHSSSLTVFEQRRPSVSAGMQRRRSIIEPPVDPYSLLAKVIVRCVVYSLVPLLANVWSFAVQLVQFEGHKPPLALVFLDAFFSAFDGLFVGIVFFTEPVIIGYLLKKRPPATVIHFEENINMRQSMARSDYQGSITSRGARSETSRLTGRHASKPSWSLSSHAERSGDEENYLSPVPMLSGSTRSMFEQCSTIYNRSLIDSTPTVPLKSPLDKTIDSTGTDPLQSPFEDPNLIPQTAKWILQELKDDQ
ncbi:hypothetical protein DM01DRAFT_1369214 [Hesseltinella vesiculosa]|uniref:Uncharacterized protein n=1 Tax=Hesseltinella vesiculosa TaxID=101127 RepID=A0A1X2GX06_9FUNG|nr:hypothetical protein DM01DRAFT_1369214 [Hesseltinella vesiculosa]